MSARKHYYVDLSAWVYAENDAEAKRFAQDIAASIKHPCVPWGVEVVTVERAQDEPHDDLLLLPLTIQ